MIQIACSLAFVAVTFFLFLANGLPFALLCGRARLWPNLLAAPIVGTALLSFLLTVLYRFGVPPKLSILAITSVSLAAAGLLWRRAYRRPRDPELRVISAGTAALPLALPLSLFSMLVITADLLPIYIGGIRFGVFQSNPTDTLNYLTEAFDYANYPFNVFLRFSEIQSAPPAIAAGLHFLFARPAVALLYGGMAKLLSPDILQYSYEFRAVLLFNQFLAMAFLFLTLIRRPWPALLLSASFAIGFYAQYVLDINAWSELLAQPIQIVFVCQWCILLFNTIGFVASPTGSDQKLSDGPLVDRTARLLSLCTLGAGLLYAYPEILPTTTLFMIGTLAVTGAFAISRGRSSVLLEIARSFLLLLAVIILTAAFFWDGTAVFLFHQLHRAAGDAVGWHTYFDKYLIATPDDIGTCTLARQICDLLYNPVFTASFVAKGLFGLFFIPLRVSKYSVVVLLWSGTLSLLALALLFGMLRAGATQYSYWRRPSGRRPPTEFGMLSLIVAGTTAAAAGPLYLFFVQQYWSAGKVFSMCFPLAFILISLPILAKQAGFFRGLSWAIVFGHFLFGLARPVAVALNPLGQFYPPPYLYLSGDLRAAYDWDISKHADELTGCRLVRIEIDQPFLERAAQIYLTEKGLPWFSASEQSSYYGAGQDLGKVLPPEGSAEDCTITDHQIVASGRLICLRYRGARRICPVLPASFPG